MDIISKPFNGRNYWRKKGYTLLDGASDIKRNIQVVKFDGEKNNTRKSLRRFWRVKRGLKFRGLKKVIWSPKKLWSKFKNGYVNMMLKMAGEVGQIDGGSEFEKKRVSQAKQVQVKYKNQEEFEARLVIEIYKSLRTSKGVSEAF
ncbi:Asparagine--tRNA ligase [Bienertia sinuspersici]